MSSNRRNRSRPLQDRFSTIGKLILLSGILVAAFFFSVIIGMRLTVRGSVVEVPSVVGMALEDAEALFQKLELTLAVSGRRFDSEVPEGAIASQVPGSGVRLKASSQVKVVVSLGRRTIPIPDLRGVSVRAARLAAEQSGFQVRTVSEVSVGTDSERRIISQYPESGTLEDTSDEIGVLVAARYDPGYVMPDLIGLNLNRVLQFFEAHDLDVTRIQYRSSPGAARGSIVRQFPEPGYLLRRSDLVHLEVAR